MSEVTSPILLDSTGQTTNTKLDNINTTLGQIKNVLTTPSAAEDISYDNTQSGMTATDVQDAVDELNSSLNDLIDLTKWSHVNGTVTVTSIGTSFTEQTVNAIKTAKMVVIKAGRIQYEFRNDGTGNFLVKTNSNIFSSYTAGNCVTSVKCDFTNGVVGLRIENKGGDISSVSLTDIWYI